MLRLVLVVAARLSVGVISGSLGLLLDRFAYGTLLAGGCTLAMDTLVFGLAHWPSLLASSFLAIFFSRFRVIGLTGGIASGKSTVAKLLLDKGAVLIDADAVSHDVLHRGRWGYKRFLAAFSEEIATSPSLLDAETGEVNRPMLRKLIFGDPQLRRKLNRALHLPIATELLRQILLHRLIRWRSFVVLDAPLLLETGLQHVCKWVVTVACTETQQLQRLRARDNTDEEDARHIISAQMPLEAKIKLSDHVIHNDGTLAQLHERVNACVHAAPRA